MSPEQILKLLSLGEGQRVEFKATFNNVEVLGQVICAFLNTSGGYLICGIEDRGNVLGVDTSDLLVSSLEKSLHDGLSPKALVSIQAQPLKGKQVLVIEVPAGKDVPYSFHDIIYIRSGEFTQKADAETIRDIVMRRQIEPERWERRFSFAELENDVDFEEVRSAVADAQKSRRAFFRDATNPQMVLEDFSLSKYGRLTNGGDVLFTRNPASRLPQIRIRAMCYNTDKAGDTYHDMKSFEGPLHVIFEEAYSFIVRNTASPVRFIKGSPKREDTPVYPEDAVREALINALAHRDYSASSGGVSIHIFPKRLEIWNAGSLPEGVTAESLVKGQISVLRNPDIAHALYLRGLMEKAGRGSVLMINQCRENGLPDPVWRSDHKLGVTLTFFAPDSIPAPSWHQDGTKLAPSRHQAEILHKCLTPKSIGELMVLVNRSDRTKFRNQVLKPLLDAQLVCMTVPDKPKSPQQQYIATPQGEQWLHDFETGSSAPQGTRTKRRLPIQGGP